MATLTPSFWEQEAEQLLAMLLPAIQIAGLTGVTEGAQKLETAQIFISNELAHAQAAEWARQFAGELIGQISLTNQRLVGEIVANWTQTPGATIGQLSKQLAQALDVNDTRAARIAATETTRAFSRGEDLVNQAAGLPAMAVQPPAHPNCRCFTSNTQLSTGEWVVVWQTRSDELVCVNTRVITPWGAEMGCRAMHQKIISQGAYLGMSLRDARREASSG